MIVGNYSAYKIIRNLDRIKKNLCKNMEKIIPITITPKAAEEIRHILHHKNIPAEYALRVVVQGGGGCGGAKFRLGFDKAKEQDEVYEYEGIKVVYEKRQLLYLLGLEIDFEERANERGFVFGSHK
ncbi:MAG: HesB/IscA family protein [Thermoflexibacteraceae bacterium]|jgi:iron-sulfur cluster assembly protein